MIEKHRQLLCHLELVRCGFMSQSEFLEIYQEPSQRNGFGTMSEAFRKEGAV